MLDARIGFGVDVSRFEGICEGKVMAGNAGARGGEPALFSDMQEKRLAEIFELQMSRMRPEQEARFEKIVDHALTRHTNRHLMFLGGVIATCVLSMWGISTWHFNLLDARIGKLSAEVQPMRGEVTKLAAAAEEIRTETARISTDAADQRGHLKAFRFDIVKGVAPDKVRLQAIAKDALEQSFRHAIWPDIRDPRRVIVYSPRGTADIKSGKSTGGPTVTVFEWKSLPSWDDLRRNLPADHALFGDVLRAAQVAGEAPEFPKVDTSRALLVFGESTNLVGPFAKAGLQPTKQHVVNFEAERWKPYVAAFEKIEAASYEKN